MQDALRRAHETYTNFPSAFPDVTTLDPVNFERWSLVTPEKWVDPETLEKNDKGQVKIGGDRVMIWRYFIVVWVHWILPWVHSASSGSHGPTDGSASPT